MIEIFMHVVRDGDYECCPYVRMVFIIVLTHKNLELNHISIHDREVPNKMGRDGKDLS